jgi:TonB-linked SusC/RagA family outer membrane protein
LGTESWLVNLFFNEKDVMKINNNVKTIVLAVMGLSLSQFLSAQSGSESSGAANATSDSVNAKDKSINLALTDLSRDRITGSSYYIDVQSELSRDSRTDLASILTGKVPGLFDAFNIWGTGNAVVVVDGLRQDAFYYENLNMLEIESILVLKDAVSKALYGAQGDQGVILINTKRGIAGKQQVRFGVDYSVSQPRVLPNYLGAADYMEKFNEAQLNEGVDPMDLRFTQGMIDSTRTGTNPTRYPDNNFYSSDYLRAYSTDVSVFADVVGGDQNARYYVSSEWAQSNGWLSTSIPDLTNRFNFRGKLDFKINQYMKMGVNASARLNMNTRPNLDADYWRAFASVLPNAYPVLWDPADIANDAAREMVLEEAKLIDNQVLGGSSSFANNQIYGDLTQNGKVRDQQRIVQFGGKLDVDLSFITEGLSANGYAGMSFYNSLFTEQNYEYAIYEPVYGTTGLVDTVRIHGVDRPTTSYNTNSDNSASIRQVSYYGTLNYQRTFDQHALSAIALIYGDEITADGVLQNNILFHSGFSANYMFDRRFVADVSVMGIGSRKLADGKRVEYAPAAGVAWILSREDFMSDLPAVDYLKLRASYGISKNDNWADYFLYETLFSRGSNFHYYNGTHNNNETVLAFFSNDIRMQKRRDISIGMDAALFNKSLNLDLGYFMSTALDNITGMSSTYSQLMGYQDLIYENYNSDRTNGIELGASYTIRSAGDFSATIGGNLLHITPKILEYEEPAYEGDDADLLRTGTATDALWALRADGLYGPDDFNTDGTLVDGLAVPTFGAVQAGDIKYIDENGDGFIDQRDERIVGHGVRTQYSIYLDLRYKNLGLYVLGVGRYGDSNYRSGSYFRVFGDVKYSTYALQAYGPDNMDVNALHPRLNTSSGGHNDRNSSYWIYENNSFTLPVIQLTYHFRGSKGLNNSRVYVRGSNLAVLNKNKEYTEVVPAGAPKLRSMVVGLVTSF